MSALIDPDCRDGKHRNCPGAPCDCPCHDASVGYAEQAAHLAEGTCDCHDSWDQCPCAETGHPADMSCGCCPLGTGLCGPRRMSVDPASTPEQRERVLQWLTDSVGYWEKRCAKAEARLAALRPEEMRRKIARVLAEHGVQPNTDAMHSWRCDEPDRYPGYCTCVPQLVDDLLAALTEGER